MRAAAHQIGGQLQAMPTKKRLRTTQMDEAYYYIYILCDYRLYILARASEPIAPVCTRAAGQGSADARNNMVLMMLRGSTHAASVLCAKSSYSTRARHD